MNDSENIVNDVRRTKEVLKEGQHKNDKLKTALTGTGAVVAVGTAGVVATTTATVATGGAAVGSLTIGGSFGAWLVAHGLAAAATVSTTVVSAPLFFGIALPAIGIYITHNILQNHKANKLLKEFYTTADIDSLGEKIAEGMIIPVIYFLRTLSVSPDSIIENLGKEMVKDLGFSESFSRDFVSRFAYTPFEKLKVKIIEQDVSITIDFGGKEKKIKEVKLSFLQDKAITLCKECINKSCYGISIEAQERAKNTIKYMKSELFSNKHKH